MPGLKVTKASDNEPQGYIPYDVSQMIENHIKRYFEETSLHGLK